MKLIVMLTLLFTTTAAWCDTPSFPWSELKRLYQKEVEEKVMNKLEGTRTKGNYVLSESKYVVELATGSAKATVTIAGEQLKGEMQPIPLFGNDLVITGPVVEKGGKLMRNGTGVYFLPKSNGAFQLSFTVLLGAAVEKNGLGVKLCVPSALKNGIILIPGDKLKVLSCSGVKLGDNTYAFPGGKFAVRFTTKTSVKPAALIEIHAYTTLGIHEKRVLLQSKFFPIHVGAGKFRLQAPEGGELIASSLNASWIQQDANGDYLISVPPDWLELFQFSFAVPFAGNKLKARLLPVIKENMGETGCFSLHTAESTKVGLKAKDLVSGTTNTILPAVIRSEFPDKHQVHRCAPEAPLELAITRYAKLNVPDLVLDAVHVFSAFEENGSCLTTLRFALSGSSLRHLPIGRVEGSKLWACTVNGKRAKVYSDGKQKWLIPLSGADQNEIELSFLQKGAKLGLRGRAQVTVPELNIPTRRLYVNIALPERVRVNSLEGPVSTAEESDEDAPSTFVGKAYSYACSFHRGEALTVAVLYEEPKSNE